MTAIAATMQAFFTERLIRQRRASPHTIAAYRDTLRLLLVFAGQRSNISPARLDFTDLDAPTVAAFLDHLEHQRGNSIRTRNSQLAAIHSLFSQFGDPRVGPLQLRRQAHHQLLIRGR
ncbi:MAG: site-specific integrase [Pseudonocardiaceae bacterium]